MKNQYIFTKDKTILLIIINTMNTLLSDLTDFYQYLTYIN